MDVQQKELREILNEKGYSFSEDWTFVYFETPDGLEVQCETYEEATQKAYQHSQQHEELLLLKEFKAAMFDAYNKSLSLTGHVFPDSLGHNVLKVFNDFEARSK